MSATASPARARRALAAAVLLCAPAALAASDRSRARGAVSYATASRAYLDHGAQAGIAAGQQIALSRHGRPASSCRVLWVSDGNAACDAPGARKGDTFELAAPAPKARSAPESLDPIPPPSEMQRRKAALASIAPPLVGFKGARPSGAAVASGLRADVSLEHGTWAATASAGGPFQAERLDASIRGAPVGMGLRLDADATALAWERRPGTTRQPNGPAQLLVRRLELSRAADAGGLVVGFGRIWPMHAVGMGALDGVQAGYRAADGAWEAGVIAGTAPEPFTTMPSLAAPTFGAYASHAMREPLGILLRTYEEARASVALEPGGARSEVEAMARASLPLETDVIAGVRASAGGSAGGGQVELAQIDLRTQPVKSMSISGGLRYTSLVDVPLTVDTSLAGRSVHGDASVTWTPLAAFGIGLSGTSSREIASGLSRWDVGPELQLPKLFGERGGLTGGYRYSDGWLGGHAGYVQLLWLPAPQFRLLARGDYFSASPASGAPMPELGAYAALDWGLTSWLRLRASAWGRIPVTASGGEGRSLPAIATLTANAGLGASF